MADVHQRTELSAALAQAAALCEQAVSQHASPSRRAPGKHFTGIVSLAIALLRACSEHTIPSDEDLGVIRGAASDAAAACRTQPPDQAVIEAAERFAAVTRTCDLLEASPPDATNKTEWRRFLFSDADIEVTRTGTRWRVRVAGREAESKLLDEALAELLRLTNHRLGEITVQVLDWNLRVPST